MTDEKKYPDMPDKFYEGLGWMHAECCAALDQGIDPRGLEVPGMIDRCIRDLTAESEGGVTMRGNNMKDRVLKIVKSALGGAEDNLYRANMQFGNMTSKELAQEYGQSGRTCGEILEEYQVEVAELKRCVEWVEGAQREGRE